MVRTRIFSANVEYKGIFDLEKFYNNIKDILKKYGWEGLPGKDYYESYYYHKITPENIYFIEIKWEARKPYWKEEPKIDWYLTLTIVINSYNPQTKNGELKVNITAEHDVEEIKKPEAKTLTENILVKIFKYPLDWLQKTHESVRVKKTVKMSAGSLYTEANTIRIEIINMLKGISVS